MDNNGNIQQQLIESEDWWISVKDLATNHIPKTSQLVQNRDPDEGLAFLLNYDGIRVDIGTVLDGYLNGVFHSATHPEQFIHSIQVEDIEPVNSASFAAWLGWFYTQKCDHEYGTLTNLRW
jgi:hypothetical protein